MSSAGIFFMSDTEGAAPGGSGVVPYTPPTGTILLNLNSDTYTPGSGTISLNLFEGA